MSADRITNEQREHIVREAIAQRDALLTAGQPRKLWLWKNFVDGRPEYWAFDNPYPCIPGGGDPLTIGEPCGYAIVKESVNGRPGVPEDKVLAAINRAACVAPSCVYARGEQQCTHVWQMVQYGATYHDLKCSMCGETKRETWD
jgi:hypothetical protein